MERVSFKVAKAIKEVGYPQDPNCDKYVTEPCKGRYIWYTPNPDYTSKGDDDDLYDFEVGEYVDHEMYNVSVAHSVVAPTYLEVWLWLWREKKKCIEVCFSLDEGNWTFMQNPSPCDCGLYNDPEEAVIAAIEYLVDANLIK